jgi:cell division transport system permease protein
LSVAATAVMTITLLIIFTAFVAQNILTDTVNQLSDKVGMSIYLKTDTTKEQGDDLIAELQKLSSVRTVSFVSSDDGRDRIVEINKDNSSFLEAIKAATNKIPATLNITVQNIDDTSQLQDFVDNNTLLKKYIDPDHKPSFAGERRDAIEKIGNTTEYAQKVGIIAGSVFVIISSLIIFNTIRMAIFNRKEEIQMMKLIGADKSFIRGPFLIESIIYGILAAIIATGIGVWALYGLTGTVAKDYLYIQPTTDLVTLYAGLVLLAMIGIGAIIGIISSLFATRSYLKL